MSKTKVAVGTACVFSAGYFTGACVQSAYVARRFKKLQPLLMKVISDIIYKAKEENMTAEELGEYCSQELDFMKIVIRNGA